MEDWLGRTSPDLTAIEDLARKTLAELPAPFAGPAQEVLIRVEDFPDDDAHATPEAPGAADPGDAPEAVAAAR